VGQACSIDLGADHTICQGQTTTITAPAGYPDYLWSTGATSQSITVGTAGTYWGEASYPSGNLAVNGNFNAGNTGFTTDFNYSSVLVTDGNYWIGTNAAAFHPQFIGTGNGQFLMVNAGWQQPGWNFWCETVPVCPGQTYTLSYRGVSLASQNPPTLSMSVNNASTFQVHTLGVGQNQWQTFNTTWTAPVGVTSAEFCLQVSSGWGIGNDFGIDDITIQSTVTMRDEVIVNVTPLPNFDLGPNATLCTGQNLVLDAAVFGGSYVWQDGSTGPGYVVSGPGNYSVTVTANNCSRTDNITVNYNARPTVDLGPDRTLCTGQTTTLNATAPGATYIWQDGSTNSNFTVTGPGTYSVQVTKNNCSASDAIDIDYNPTPTLDLGADRTACAGENVVLNATTPGATYVWQDGSTDPTLTVTSAGTFSAVITVNGCTATDAVDVAFTPLPVVDLGPDQTVCPGTVVTLDAMTASGTYVWQDGSALATFNATTPGTYTVEVTVNDCSNTDSFKLSNFTLQTVDLGPDITICQGQATTIGVSVTGATAAWNTGASTPTINVSTSGTYWQDVTLNGCVVRDSIDVIVTPLPVFDLGVDRTICPGTLTTLDATTPSATYAWSTSAHTATIDVGPGNYNVTVTANGCDATDNITVNAWPTPTVNLGNDATLCPGTPLVLNATQTGASYLWQDGSTDPTYTVTTDGMYAVTLTDANGCLAMDVINVDYATPTPIDLGPDSTICQGSTMTLDATTAGATYLWSTGATSATITVSTANTYSVVVTQGSCTESDAIDIHVAAVPTVALGPDVLLCPGADIMLNATGSGLSYAWNTGATTPTITVNSGGTYSVVVTNAANCTATDAVDVAYATPSAVDLGADITLCQGESKVLDATLSGATYAWSTGASTPTITVNSAGTYSVTVTQGTCSVSDQVAVTVNPMPLVNLGNDATLCAGDDITLNAAWTGAAYTWNTGASTPTITVNTSGSFSVDVDLNGCIASDAININVLSATSVDLGPDRVICAGEQVVLDANTPGSTYLWSTGATTPTITVTTSGTYSVTVSTGQCSVSDQVAVTVNPSPQIDLGTALVFCDGEVAATLDATWPGATYLWSTGGTTGTINVDASGTYSVAATLDGCTTNDDVNITFGSLSYSLGADTTLCPGQELLLGTGLPNGTATWNGTVISPNFTVTHGGEYRLLFTSASGCSVRDTINVGYENIGTLDLGPDLVRCEGEAVELDASLVGATILWEDGSSDPVRTVSTGGTYSVEAQVAQCVITDAVTITFNPLPSVNIGPDPSLCPGSDVTFNATATNATYLWQNGSTSPTFTTSAPGPVSVSVTVDGCTASDAAEVIHLDGPSPWLGNDTTICNGSALHLQVNETGTHYTWDDGSQELQRTVGNEGIYWVDATRNSCTARDSIFVNILSTDDIDLGNDRTICAGTTTELDATYPGASYEWSNGATTPTITVSSADDYAVTISVSGCSVEETIAIAVLTMHPPDPGPDRSICQGDETALSIAPTTAHILWSTGATTRSIRVDEAGTYTVTLDSLGCTASAEVVVTTTTMSNTMDLGPDRTLCNGVMDIIQAPAISGATYTWNTGFVGPWLSIDAPGTYTVHATGFCIDAYATITVEPADCGTYVFVPNTFTPNGDDHNDIFLPSIAGPLDRYQLDIFDRWGERIYSTDDRGAGWDGSYNGVASQDGVYVWTLNYRVLGPEGVKSERLIGHVTLLR
jgi:gliding motility-associated-like protein